MPARSATLNSAWCAWTPTWRSTPGMGGTMRPTSPACAKETAGNKNRTEPAAGASNQYNGFRVGAVDKPMSSRTKYFVVSTSTCLTVLLLIGSVLGRSASPDDTYKHIGVFSDVVSRIKSEYVEEPDMKSVTLGALNGMLEAIDPFASY